MEGLVVLDDVCFNSCACSAEPNNGTSKGRLEVGSDVVKDFAHGEKGSGLEGEGWVWEREGDEG